jgi:hypothetical protein
MAATNHKRVNLDPARPLAHPPARAPAHPLTRPPRVGGGRRAESNGRIGRRGDSALPSLPRSLPPNYISPANPLSPSPSPLRPPFSSIPQAPNPRCGCALQTASTAGPTSHNHSYPKVSKGEQATPFLSLSLPPPPPCSLRLGFPSLLRFGLTPTRSNFVRAMKPHRSYSPFRGSGGCSSNARCLMAMLMVSGMCSCFVDVHFALVPP